MAKFIKVKMRNPKSSAEVDSYLNVDLIVSVHPVAVAGKSDGIPSVQFYHVMDATGTAHEVDAEVLESYPEFQFLVEGVPTVTTL